MAQLVQIDQSKVRDIMNDPEAERFLEQKVASAVRMARDGTPYLSGEHQEAIIGYINTDKDGNLQGNVGSISKTWHLIEFGSYHNSPSRSITHGVEAAGIQFTSVGPGTKVPS